MSSLKKFVDVKEVIASKNPSLAKLMPGFLLRFIRKTIHEDEINETLEKYKGVSGLDFVDRMVNEKFKIQAQLHGFENVPNDGRFIFVANHPWGAMEAITLLDTLAKKRSQWTFRFIVNDLLMRIKNYEPLFLPVNKHGAQGRENARILEENFASDKQILIFPAGLVSRVYNGKVRDPEWKHNFITKSVQHQRDIIPIYIDGKNSNFFYRLYKFRKWIGIKTNLEMFYLVDETDKHKNEVLPYYFGKPISYKVFDKSKSKKEWAKSIENFVYSLKDDCNQTYDPNN